jgi:hypothetical protein
MSDATQIEINMDVTVDQELPQEIKDIVDLYTYKIVLIDGKPTLTKSLK